MIKYMDNSKSREDEAREEAEAVSREAFEEFCDEQGFDPESDEAYIAWQAAIRDDDISRISEDDLRIEEWQMRQQDIAEERDIMWE